MICEHTCDRWDTMEGTDVNETLLTGPCDLCGVTVQGTVTGHHDDWMDQDVIWEVAALEGKE